MKVKSTPLYVVVFGHFKGYCNMSDLRKTPYNADLEVVFLWTSLFPSISHR